MIVPVMLCLYAVIPGLAVPEEFVEIQANGCIRSQIYQQCYRIALDQNPMVRSSEKIDGNSDLSTSTRGIGNEISEVRSVERIPICV